jgi:peroxiredoxin
MVNKTVWKTTRAVIGASLFLAMAGWAAEPATVPRFSLPDLDGKIWNSSQFASKPLIVDFWATWCNTCKETVPKLAELQEKFKNKGLTVIGISVDKGSAEKIRKAAKKLGINYLVLIDKENSLAASFGFSGIPSLYIFDKRGNLNTAMPGYDPDQESVLNAATEKALL